MEMRKILGVLAICLLGSAVALATDVTYYAVGVFSNDPGGTASISNATGGAGTSSATITSCLLGCSNEVLSFTSVGATSNPPPTTINLGSFSDSAGLRTGNFSNVDFDLYIYQTNLGTGNNDFAGEISGKLGLYGATDDLEWTPNSPPTFSISGGGVIDTYTLNNFGSDGDYDLSTATLIPVEVKASLTQVTTVPEPGSLALLGSGLLTLGGMLRRRFR
jgi:hypothetical protein